MSVNLLKTGVWAMIGGTAFAAVAINIQIQMRHHADDEPLIKRNLFSQVSIDTDILKMFAVGTVAGAAFKIIGIPAIQLLASSTLKAGRAIYDQRVSFYNGIKWLFTK